MTFDLPGELHVLAVRHEQLARHAVTRAGLETALTVPDHFVGQVVLTPDGPVVGPAPAGQDTWRVTGTLDLGPVRRGEALPDLDAIFAGCTATAVRVADVLRAVPATVDRAHGLLVDLAASARAALGAAGAAVLAPSVLTEAERERPVLRLAEQVAFRLGEHDRLELVWLDEAGAVLVSDVRSRREGWRLWAPVGGGSRTEVTAMIKDLRIEVLRVYDELTLAEAYRRADD